jgi:hypothetical protein
MNDVFMLHREIGGAYAGGGRAKGSLNKKDKKPKKITKKQQEEYIKDLMVKIEEEHKRLAQMSSTPKKKSKQKINSELYLKYRKEDRLIPTHEKEPQIDTTLHVRQAHYPKILKRIENRAAKGMPPLIRKSRAKMDPLTLSNQRSRNIKNYNSFLKVYSDPKKTHRQNQLMLKGNYNNNIDYNKHTTNFFDAKGN